LGVNLNGTSFIGEISPPGGKQKEGKTKHKVGSSWRSQFALRWRSTRRKRDRTQDWFRLDGTLRLIGLELPEDLLFGDVVAGDTVRRSAM
jgi:hypothetical protein